MGAQRREGQGEVLCASQSHWEEYIPSQKGQCGILRAKINGREGVVQRLAALLGEDAEGEVFTVKIKLPAPVPHEAGQRAERVVLAIR